MSGSRTSTPTKQQGQKRQVRGELDSPKFLASKPLSSICPTPPHLLPHPTSRDLADPVKLRLALHGYPLQGGQVQHCTASDIIVIMSAPGKIVVGKLEREGLHTGNQEAQAELRTAKPGECPVRNPITFNLLTLAKTPARVRPCYTPAGAHLQPSPTHLPILPPHGSSPLDRRSSASCDPL
jgi:hypothetical protein